MYKLDDDETGVVLKICNPVSVDFPTMLRVFCTQVDKELLMGNALGRSPEDCARGILDEIADLGELWEPNG